MRRSLTALLAVVPVVPVVAGLTLNGEAKSAGASRPFSPSDGGPSMPVQHTHGIPAGPGALVAILARPTVIRDAPAGRSIARLGLYTEFGSRQAVWVAERSRGWLGVVTPQLGNGRIGWISPSAVRFFRNPWELSVSLSSRSLRVLEYGHLVASYTVTIGRPDAPTPTGRFAVTDRLLTGDSSGPYGCCVVALSAVSPHAIQGWGGGNRIAIHSTPDTSTIGQAVSHGCLRVTLAEGRWLLGHLPLGTPTLIST